MNIIMSLISICVISLLLVALPLIGDRKFYKLEGPPQIYYSMQTKEFKYALIVSLSISIPLLVELGIRIILMQKSWKIFLATIAPNTLTLLLLTIPDLITLFYLTESLNIYIFGFFFVGRIILLICVMLIFVYSSGGKIWSSRGILFVSLTACAARVIGFYRDFVIGQTQYYMMEYFSLALNILALVTYLFMLCKWFHYIYYETKTHPLTTNQYLCNIYTIAALICWVGLTVNQFLFKNATYWLQWDVNALTTHTLIFTVFYIFIIVFEGRVMQREMLQTKASSIYYLISLTFNFHIVGGTRDQVYVHPLHFS